jgi:hypothetical protein
MDLIKAGKLEEIKPEFGVDFELSDENMFIFEGIDDISNFTSALASLPIYIAYYNRKTDGMGIGYHVYGGAEGEEFKKQLVLNTVQIPT